jgi:hypothetical protein
MNEIYAKAVMKFGVKAQLNVALEELAFYRTLYPWSNTFCKLETLSYRKRG